MKQLFKKFDEKIRFLEENITSMFLLISCFIVFINVILRYLFGMSMIWAEEVSRYLIIWVTFIGAAALVRTGDHVNMDMVLHILPKNKIRYYLIRLIALGGTIFSIFFITWGIKLVLQVYNRGQVSPSLGFPMYIVYLAIPIGGVMMFKNFLHLFVIKCIQSEPNDDLGIDVSGEFDEIEIKVENKSKA